MGGMNLDVLGLLEFVATHVARHWPAFVYTLGLSVALQLAKRTIFSPTSVTFVRVTRDRLWNTGKAYKRAFACLLVVFLSVPLPFYPLFAAAWLSVIPGLPISVDEEARRLYFFCAAFVSLGFYDIVHAILKRKGLDVRLPGEPPQMANVRPSRPSKN